MATPAAFVGREGELSRLLAALGGDARLVLVVGDAGVGKTRFADEGMARAAAAGAVMVRGECLPLAEALPLLPVAAALGELAAGNSTQELPARMAAAGAAERVFGYAEAAGHWQRAIELCRAQPGTTGGAGIDVPDLYLRAMDALHWSGNRIRAGELAEEAYRRFAEHPDAVTAAVVRHRAAVFRALDTTGAGLELIEEALGLFEQAPPSAGQARAWLDYGDTFLRAAEGRQEDIFSALNRALEIAEAAGATALTPRILASLAEDAFRHGKAGEGFAFLERGWALAGAAEDGVSMVWLAVNESEALLKLARFQDAADIALRGLEPARQAGLAASGMVSVLASYASEALLARGRTAEAAALIDPLTSGPRDRDHWPVHQARAEIDMLRGDIAAGRQRIIDTTPAHVGNADFARESAQRAAELALWAGCPGEALVEVQRVLPLFKIQDLTILCGRLLAAGMRACADLAEQARARRDGPAAEAAGTAADGLTVWAGQVAGAPFTEHRFVATIPAERATWDAERTRLAGASDPQAWSAAAQAWDGLGCPHRAGYAWWRQAQAQLDAGQPPPGAATRRSAPSCTSARRPPACTCPASCASWGSPAGCRPPPWPNEPACCPRRGPKHHISGI